MDDLRLGIEKMKGSNWAEARRLFQRYIDFLGRKRGEDLFGKKHYMIYYSKGYCELKLI